MKRAILPLVLLLVNELAKNKEVTISLFSV